MYLTIVLGSYYPIKVTVQTVNDMGQVVSTFDPVSVWVVLLLIYAYVASTLPVHTLLQPRDYINSHQLFIAMGLLGLGVLFAHPDMVAPPVVENPPVGSLPLFPMLFVFVACGAISGFHSLVSSGTSSKQCSSEKDALSIGYGSMLLEGMLAVFVIIACAGGIGLGYQEDGQTFTGYAAFAAHYDSWKDANSLGAKLGAFVIGATRMIEVIGIPAAIATILPLEYNAI
jgi:carbon starvation protein